MKIGLVCPYNITRGGGVQECVLALQAELKYRGHQAKIITFKPPGAAQKTSKDILLVGAGADIKSPFHTTAQVSVSGNPEELTRLLDKEAFDVLHFHEPWVPMLSRQLLSRSKAINIATFHAKLPDTTMSRTIEKVITPYTKSVLKYLDGLAAVSEAAAEYVRSITDEPIEIIPNGIDLTIYNRIAKPAKPSARKKILYIGRLEKRKGLKYLLQAYKYLSERRDDLSLIIAGDGPDAQKLKEFVRANQLTNVTFMGWISEKEKIRLLQTADLFCSPALYGESFGIVLLEAMATGTVTVAGNNPGYTAVLRESGTLSLVNPKDTEQFAEKINTLLQDEGLRTLWREWAEVYVQNFSYSKVVDQYEKLYKTISKKTTSKQKSDKAKL